jgi:hypothetical protein
MFDGLGTGWCAKRPRFQGLETGVAPRERQPLARIHGFLRPDWASMSAALGLARAITPRSRSRLRGTRSGDVACSFVGRVREPNRTDSVAQVGIGAGTAPDKRSSVKTIVRMTALNLKAS